MSVPRNLAAEQRAVGQFRAANGGRMPDLNNENDRAKVYRMAYPTTGPSAGLPDELRSTVNASLYAGGQSPNTNTYGNLSQNVEGSNLSQLGQNLTNAEAGVEKMSQPNEALRILQEAIRAKSGIANQPIGESELFKAAGVTGYGALGASIAEQGNKLEYDFANFSNIVGQMRGQYQDMANLALKKYEMAHTAYKDESTRLQGILDDAREQAQAIEMMNMQFQNSVKLKDWENKNLDPLSLAALKKDGFLPDGDGGIMDDNDLNNGIVTVGDTSFNLGKTYPAGSWAANQKTHATAIQSILNGIGKFNNEVDVIKYINNYNKQSGKKSPITADMVFKASEKNGVPWEMIVAMMQHESNMGTSNVAVKNNNYAGVTWNPNYPASMKGTARPASEGGYYVKFATPQEGLNEFTKFLKNRQQKGVATGSTDFEKQFAALPTSAFGSVSSQKEAKKMLSDLVKSGDIEGAEQMVDSWARNALTGTQKNDFGSFEEIKNGTNSILGEWESLAVQNAGYYKNIYEKTKPFAKVVKDQKWVDFVSKIELQQAKFRNAIYGASLTNNEKDIGTGFLIDPSKDDIKTIETKLKNMRDYAESLQRSYLDSVKGVKSSDGKRKEISKNNVSGGSAGKTSSGMGYTIVK